MGLIMWALTVATPWAIQFGPTEVASILVAVIAASSAVASNRAAARASTMNTNTTSRIDMEREAYERARKFDLETIARQDRELTALRAEVNDLEEQVDILRWRLNRAERGLPPAPYPEGKRDDGEQPSPD